MFPCISFYPLFLLSLLTALPRTYAHGFLKAYVSDSSPGWKPAQRGVDLQNSIFRGLSDNTGWIGSKFLSNPGIVCGCSNTPFGKVENPSGNVFSSASLSAGKTLPVNPGEKIKLIIGGNPGEGWPHKNGHVNTYLGFCGKSATACEHFDASQAEYFKIQSEPNAIQNKLKPAYQSDQDGNLWEIVIPPNVPQGSYILRYELIVIGESSKVEGEQDQYYPFCGQIYVQKKPNNPVSLDSVPTGHFPGDYVSKNLEHNVIPGPKLMSIFSEVKETSLKSESLKPQAVAESSSNESFDDPELLSLPSTAPECAQMCLGVKFEEMGSLAPSCKDRKKDCLCGTMNFVKAYHNCVKDHCGVSFSA
uniref:lytic cellulose monooxygenase (C4-dehydrogenating) n=1 Tax=Hemileia vastatrix TaxID=203904 RepID=T1UNB0_9BASI|nr:endoglucanase 4 [Hemileia vastatrix]